MAEAPVETKFHDMLKPLSWLFGNWRSEEGKGQYPTLNDFTYAEEAEFSPVGLKPIVEYKLYSWKPGTDNSLHRETGFIRVEPGTSRVAFVAAHNFGVVEIQEGEVKHQELRVETMSVGRTSFSKLPEVKKIIRTLKRNGDTLEQVTEMQTERTGMAEHLRVTFKKAA